jgi:hypothetical protein
MLLSTKRCDASIADKAEGVIQGIGQGVADAARDVKRAVAGDKVDVTLGERHMVMPREIEAGSVMFRVTNVGSEDRGFQISGPGLERSLTAPLAPGETTKLTIDLEPGVYRVTAPVPSDPSKLLMVELTVQPPQ